MNILMFAASSRQDSLNKKLIHCAADLVKLQQHQVMLQDFSVFQCELYHGDVEQTKGLPAGAIKLIQELNNSDALIIASPEYNYSTPGTLKNLIDWVSRAKPMPWKHKPILLLSASPAMAGGHRGLLQTMIPLQCCQAYVYPNTFSLSNADQMFNEKGMLKDEQISHLLEKRLVEFMQYVAQLSQ